ncbi:DUF434 domain-containing protein [Lewinella sp. LCG006]|uniref:DUF434 domain-containing protein n=1 Tax=Lewinella sp. LCG006 TaxID=3231911 RepID=UPI00345F602D
MNPTTRQRGKHPNDDQLFGVKWPPIFKEAIDDHSFLLERGYGTTSALEIVGNRYRLNKRQRQALLRMSVAPSDAAQRQAKTCNLQAMNGATVAIDGFNLLILLENAFSGAYIFHCRDGCLRDISSVHGSYKHIQQTSEAIKLIGDVLQTLEVAHVKWLLDQPISNSGRLRVFLEEISADHDFPWEVELCFDPDKVLAVSPHIVVSADGWVIDQAEQWFNLGAYIIEHHLPAANIFRA